MSSTINMYSVTVSPDETANVYGVDSDCGFVIKSYTNLAGQVGKIQEILAAFITQNRSQDYLNTRTVKFNKYVYDTPKESWESNGEYQLFKNANDSLERSKQELNRVKNKFEVISITSFKPNYDYYCAPAFA